MKLMTKANADLHSGNIPITIFLL